ncbi:hypothetical protein Barb4_01125 [Bacteroidales bacterium Barb4]|nr:hypothetical protein Barb4_01125 [Bacteroidales bacterium Barb4]
MDTTEQKNKQANELTQSQIDNLNKVINEVYDGKTSEFASAIADFIHAYARILFLAMGETGDIVENIEKNADPWVITEIYKALTKE